jgi:hypothetical protein
MRKTGITLAAAAFCAAALFDTAAWAAGPHEFTAQVDLRLTASDSSLTSFRSGGLGLLRYDASQNGVHIGPLLLDYNGPVTDTIRASVTAFATADGDKNPIDLTEAMLEWRPVPVSMWRWRARLGAFYPPISMENRGIGWQSIYTLSSSAINTWIGEEVRAIGGELNLTATGAGSGRSFDVGGVVGAYGWNDPMGVVIQKRGWAIHDRQTALFGRLPDINGIPGADGSYELFREIDHRVGYYGGVEFTYLDRVVLRALHYDNRGDPGVHDTQEWAWLSRFNAYGLRVELPDAWTVIAQRLDGDTSVGVSADGRGNHILGYWSDFLLVSKAIGQHRLSARYEQFHTTTERGAARFDSHQDGEALTLAYRLELSDRWQMTLEGLRVNSTLRHRLRIAEPPNAIESSVQLVARYSLTL